MIKKYTHTDNNKKRNEVERKKKISLSDLFDRHQLIIH